MTGIIEELRTARERGERPSASGEDLRDTYLRDADLRDASLWAANLSAADLMGADMRGADLLDAHLRGANLTSANLRYANLRRVDLKGANLWGANLSGADLRDADLRDADLWGANLCGANLWGGLPIQAGASGSGYLIPTPDGWRITIGCWNAHTLDDLRDLIEGRADWPEATGDERDRRRPMLRAVLALCEAHIGQHEGLIESLAERWGVRNV